MAKGRRVAAAKVPAHKLRGPALASLQRGNTLTEGERVSRRRANQDKRSREFPGKLLKNADFLWTGLPYGP